MINGIINVYKEPGFTSHDVVAKLRGIVKQKKIGHTGTLDPDAAGVLPVCLGRATKVAGMLTDERKTYECVMLLGVTTDTQDISGSVLRERPLSVIHAEAASRGSTYPNLVTAGSSAEENGAQPDSGSGPVQTAGNSSCRPEEAVLHVIRSFEGPQLQIPPMYSALKRDGKKLYELALAHNCLIIEDNPYGDLRYYGEDVPSIKSFDTEGIVIYSGSFSKVVSPGIRAGYMMANKAAMAKMIICKQGQDVHTTMWSQMLCNELMTKYDFEKHLDYLRALYTEKAALCMDLLDKYVVPHGIHYNKIEGGLFIWCDLPEDVDMLDFCKKLTERKVCVVPGNAFLTDSAMECHSFRINFSTPTDEQLTQGIIEIGKLAEEIIG